MRYFFGFLASLALIVLVFVLVLRGFSGDSTTKDRTPLSEYANTDALVRLTVDGRIVSEQEHRAYQITVGRSEVRVETLKGYEYETLETRTYENNQESFNNFLRALDLAGYTRGIEDGDNRDERGVCAEGYRYVYEILSGTSEVQRFWATSCKGFGTFKGSAPAVKLLFDKQVPTIDRNKTIGRLQL
jgi:hypothetical protein